MNDARYSELIAKYLSGELNPDEKRELMSWVEQTAENKAFFEEMIQLWSISNNYDATNFNADIPDAWTVLEQKLDTPTGSLTSETTSNSKTAKIRPLWSIVVRVAAIGLVAAVVAYWVFQQNTPENALQIVQTGAGEQQEVVLPDSSRVWLNENTTLAYNPAFAQRIVQLSGEAFFEVTHMEDLPFEVESTTAKTVVLGTSFNVRAYPQEEQVEVTVETGKVLLSEQSSTEEKSVVLAAGTSGIYRKPSKELVKKEEKLDNAAAWKTKKLNFTDVPMSEVIADLERYFDIDIQTPNENILNCPYTADFPNPSLESVLTAVSFSINGQVEQTGTAYILQGQGCNTNSSE